MAPDLLGLFNAAPSNFLFHQPQTHGSRAASQTTTASPCVLTLRCICLGGWRGEETQRPATAALFFFPPILRSSSEEEPDGGGDFRVKTRTQLPCHVEQLRAASHICAGPRLYFSEPRINRMHKIAHVGSRGADHASVNMNHCCNIKQQH